MPNDSANDNATLNDEAAHWLIRLRADDLSAAERTRFEMWLDADPRHAQALHRAHRIWDEMGQVSEPRVRRRSSRRPGRLRPWQALAASVALLFTIGAWHLTDPVTAFSADQRTGFGEVRRTTLADGSAVYLNTNSAVSIEYADESRTVVLLKGEASFDVAPVAGGEHRPFVVQARGGQARALGTRFTVRVDDNRVRVDVEEHRVAVAPPEGGMGRTAELGEGESVVYTADGEIEAVTSIDAAHGGAWRRGRLVFDRQPLSAVVAELNRYRAGRIVVADRDLRARLVSGVFHIDDLSRAVGVIAEELDAKSVSVTPLMTVIF